MNTSYVQRKQMLLLEKLIKINSHNFNFFAGILNAVKFKKLAVNLFCGNHICRCKWGIGASPKTIKG